LIGGFLDKYRRGRDARRLATLPHKVIPETLSYDLLLQKRRVASRRRASLYRDKNNNTIINIVSN